MKNFENLKGEFLFRKDLTLKLGKGKKKSKKAKVSKIGEKN